MNTFVVASMIWETAVGTMLLRPWKYPRRADMMEMKNMVGARAMTALSARGLPENSAMGTAPKNMARHPRRPMVKNSQKATENTRSASFWRPWA